MTEELWDLLPENERANLSISRKTGSEHSKGVSSNDGPSPLTEKDAQKILLLLSSYQDGSGMTPLDNGLSLPGWRDFERVVAAALNGKPPKGREGKNVFDVVVPIIKNTTFSIEQGISCKMKNGLNTISTTGHVSMDLANAAGGFADYLKSKGIYPADYRKKPREVGIGVIELVKLWHEAESIHNGGRVELNQSYYLVLSWNDEKQQQFQLHQFALTLPDPEKLEWHYRSKKGDTETIGLHGDDENGRVFDWYSSSGGQLKYYPLASEAIWHTSIFKLVPLPSSEEIQYGLVNRAKRYFPKEWEEVFGENE